MFILEIKMKKTVYLSIYILKKKKANTTWKRCIVMHTKIFYDYKMSLFGYN